MSLSIVILAAGQGTRMRSSRPKVLQPLAGQPLLRHVVNCSRELGADDICVVYGHGGDAVPKAFEGESLRWALQAEQLGTGHAVMQAMPHTPGKNKVLILAGDVPLLMSTTLRRLLDACSDNDFGILTVDINNPYGYGRIVRKGENVQRIVEEKDASEAERAINEINSGVMCCNAGRLQTWLSRLNNDNSQGEYYLTDVIALAVADGVAVHGVKADSEDEVMGINDKKQLAKAERALQQRRVAELMAKGVGFADPARVDIRGSLTCGSDVYIDVNAIFEGDVVLGDNVVIESNNLIRNCKLGAGTVVHPNCHLEGSATGANCELGPFARLRPGANLADNVKAGNFVEIKKSNIGPGSKVNHLTYIGDTEMGSMVNVGAGTITCNYDGANKHLTKIGDGAFIGSGVNLVAPIEVGAGATIGAGTTLSKKAPDGKLTVARARQVTIDGWQKPQKKPKPPRLS
ncbi:MAG: bifunctional UDP-N-acetylglucosamine diphosphorylase/glucosamine-1-phosphate N-acetyltransferase GlmU [Gammaproteobacteria bacterium]|nr:bifunctional UDP-N-acetylglucosamine diphosphorylase/glucosamine-1-phosphate N-acetyltransferase GlmU [Gammaproteobacteria bacterium]